MRHVLRSKAAWHIMLHILNKGEIYIGLSKCSVKQHIKLTRCYKCLGYDHIAVQCKEDKQRCYNRCEAHEKGDCKKNTLLLYNCYEYNLRVKI